MRAHVEAPRRSRGHATGRRPHVALSAFKDQVDPIVWRAQVKSASVKTDVFVILDFQVRPFPTGDGQSTVGQRQTQSGQIEPLRESGILHFGIAEGRGIGQIEAETQTRPFEVILETPVL
jgi:hypothetical protein